VGRQHRTLHHARPFSARLRHNLMARTKWIPKPRPPQSAKRDAPQETAKREAWTAAIELGASNGQAMVKKPDGQWELVRWAQGVSASSVGGALICRSSERLLGFLTKRSSKDGTSRTLPIRMWVKSPNSGGLNKSYPIRLSHPAEGYVTYICT
jgi:hypothetical protein